MAEPDTSASPTSFPNAIPVKELLVCHAEYNPRHPVCDCGVLQFYHDLYASGIDFERNKGTYLRSRQLDKQQKGGAQYRLSRLNCAHYTPIVSGITDSFIGALMKCPPRIEVAGADDPRAAYWLSLNEDADGFGRDLASVAYNLILQMVLHRRPHLSIYCPERTEDSARLDEAKKSGSLDARMTYLNAAAVDDWQMCDDEIEWVRTHAVDYRRDPAKPYGPMDLARHTWTFITKNAIYEYVAQEVRNEKGEKMMPEGATLQEPKKHGLNALPVIPVEVERGFWVMNRLASTALALFNREASLEFALDSGALNMPILATDKPPDSVMLSELGCLDVGVQGTFSFAAPSGEVFTALKNDCDRLISNLYSAIHAMALQAAGQQENARQSGTAKQFDKEPMQALMRLFAAPILDALKKAVKIIAEYRGETNLEIKVVGLDEFDTQAIELEINKAAKFNAIPGMRKTAINEMNKRLTSKVMPDAPEVIESFDDEEEDLDSLTADIGKIPLALQQLALARQRFIETGDAQRAERVAKRMDALLAKIDSAGVEPVSKTANQAPAEIRNPKTNEPQGFGSSQVRAQFTQTR